MKVAGVNRDLTCMLHRFMYCPWCRITCHVSMLAVVNDDGMRAGALRSLCYATTQTMTLGIRALRAAWALERPAKSAGCPATTSAPALS